MPKAYSFISKGSVKSQITQLPYPANRKLGLNGHKPSLSRIIPQYLPIGRHKWTQVDIAG